MNVLTILILIFSLVGIIDKLLGNKWGLGKEFEKGFSLFIPMAFSMIGMLVITMVFIQKLVEHLNNVYNVDNVKVYVHNI